MCENKTCVAESDFFHLWRLRVSVVLFKVREVFLKKVEHLPKNAGCWVIMCKVFLKK